MEAVLKLLDSFYASTVQNIKPWAAAPPKLRPSQPPPETKRDVPVQIVSTSLSSQDGADAVEPVGPESAKSAPRVGGEAERPPGAS